ncbi:MAG: hypothetical protein JO061_21710 [Acidobacteriaceae bacterium]|nr:hypothetical protein [Acidobacteriaceae bacterium]
MLLPSTHEAAVLLLALCFVCLGSWPNLFRLARWRYQLFYFDFAAGALVLAIAAALALGMRGSSELSYVDRLAVAGLRSQAFVIAGGFIFNLGNMLLLAAVSLLGIGPSFLLTFSLALLVSAATSWSSSNQALLVVALLCAVAAAIAAAFGALKRRLAPPALPRRQPQKPAPRSTDRAAQGIVAGAVAGFLIGGSRPIASAGFWGDLGLGAYAGTLMFAIGMAISTLLFNVFLMNIAIEGERTTFPAYTRGSARQHAFGVVAGILWAVGFLSLLLALSVPADNLPGSTAIAWWTQGFVLLAVFWGILAWKELTSKTRRPGSFLAGCALFAAAVAAFALSLKH